MTGATNLYRLEMRTNIFRLLNTILSLRRANSGVCGGGGKNGLVLGVYEGCEPGEFTLTPAALKFDESVNGKFKELIKGTKLRSGKAQIFGNLSEEYYLVAAAGLGHESAAINRFEQLDECKENIRTAAGVGAMDLQNQGIGHIHVEEFTNAEAAAEGASLGVWRYQEWRDKDKRENVADIQLWGSEDKEAWTRGIIKGEAQNRAREIQEAPPNLMTPSIFAQYVQELLCPCGVDVHIRDRDWLDAKSLHAFLSMARGSCETPVVVEISYCGAGREERPIVLIGKGVTYDSGGINLKRTCQKNMDIFRGELAGAAAVVGIIRAIAQMSLPLNVVALLAMYENLPSGLALKPGDVVMARNGKSIRIEDTDNEGRVVIADLLPLTAYYTPCLNITIATSHIGLYRSLGTPVNAVFSTSNVIFWELERAATVSGDRIWRLPLWKTFRSKVTNFTSVDVTNSGKGACACLCAAYLLEFNPPNIDFLHVDISATGLVHSGIGMPYLRRHYMTGRPVRLLTQFLYQIACPHEIKDDC